MYIMYVHVMRYAYIEGERLGETGRERETRDGRSPTSANTADARIN